MQIVLSVYILDYNFFHKITIYWKEPLNFNLISHVLMQEKNI
jgi:hypothetical protein